MKISNVKLIFRGQCSVSYLKFMFRTRRFHMWNFEPGQFTCEVGISYVKMFPFHMWDENFINENLPIPYVFHMWNFYQGIIGCFPVKFKSNSSYYGFVNDCLLVCWFPPIAGYQTQNLFTWTLKTIDQAGIVILTGI